MAHIVKCRICKAQFDTEKLSEDEWVMPNPKYYYHKHCYEDWIKNKSNIHADNRDIEFWKESLIDYLLRDVRMEINYAKFNNQWRSFTSPDRKMTPKGIYFSLKYYYEVIKGDVSKAQGGIGIAPNIYKDAATYWGELERKQRGTIDMIIEQINLRKEREIKSINIHQSTPKKNRFNLEDI